MNISKDVIGNFKLNGKDQFYVETDTKADQKAIFGLTRNWIYRNPTNPATKDISKREVFYLKARDEKDATDHFEHWFPMDHRWLQKIDENHPKDKVYTCEKVEL
jgi:hypothetical protein